MAPCLLADLGPEVTSSLAINSLFLILHNTFLHLKLSWYIISLSFLPNPSLPLPSTHTLKCELHKIKGLLALDKHLALDIRGMNDFISKMILELGKLLLDQEGGVWI